MRTEAFKSYKQGFSLDEQELRRLYGDALNYIEKKVQRENIQQSFEIKFENGAIAKPSKIDEVLSQENVGTKAIKRLSIILSDRADDIRYANYGIAISFDDVHNHASENPITLSVIGDERDWVFVTTSELEERIARTSSMRVDKKGILSVLLLLATLALIVSMWQLLGNENKRFFDGLREQHKAGQLTDPIDAMIRIGERQQELTSGSRMRWPLMLSFGLLLLVSGARLIENRIASFLNYVFPSYIFYWGSAVAYHERRRKYLNIIFVVIILAGLVGVVSSLIANGIWARLYPATAQTR
jgi:hypothetical protein